MPHSIGLDSIGLNIDTASIKGFRQTYYLWNDVESIRYRTVSAKHSAMLVYDAILKKGKKAKFLSFDNYNAKKNCLDEINIVLQNISNKQVQQK